MARQRQLKPVATNSNPDPSVQARIASLKARIEEIDLVCSGTLRRRTKVCGKPNCSCATDDNARHGPYWEWSRRERGKLIQSSVSPQRAARMMRAMRNARTIQALLGRWERESMRIMSEPDDTS